MNNAWLPYPENKPDNTAAAQKADYVVLIANPFYTNKSGITTTTPRYRVELALWLGTEWLPIDADYIGNHSFNVKFFIKLPPHN